MTMRFLDTNILLRHLTRDDPKKAEACTRLFQDIETGKLSAWTSDLVVAEVVFVLSSKGPNGYNYTREEIRTGLVPLLALPGLALPSKRFYRASSSCTRRTRSTSSMATMPRWSKAMNRGNCIAMIATSTRSRM